LGKFVVVVVVSLLSSSDAGSSCVVLVVVSAWSLEKSTDDGGRYRALFTGATAADCRGGATTMPRLRMMPDVGGDGENAWAWNSDDDAALRVIHDENDKERVMMIRILLDVVCDARR